jgi:hypothetical protein
MAELFDLARRPRVRFAGVFVAPQVVDVALEALDYFNRRTGHSYAPLTARGEASESLKRIVGAMVRLQGARELYREMIDAALIEPWWKGAPHPGVVFGPKVADRNLERARAMAKPAESWEMAKGRVLAAVGERRMRSNEGVFAAEFLRAEGLPLTARWVEAVGLSAAAEQARVDDRRAFDG